MRTARAIEVSAADRLRVAALVRDPRASEPIVARAAIMLMAARGCGIAEIRWRTGKHRGVVTRWTQRFQQAGLSGLFASAPWLRDPSPISELRDQFAVIKRGSQLCDRQAASELTEFARVVLDQIWMAHGEQLRLPPTLPLSDDPELVPKIRQILGLYLDPPPNSVVIGVDEKSRIPIGPRERCGSWPRGTHSEFGPPTTTLMAALDVHTGKVLGRCMQRQRHGDLLRFLNGLAMEIPVDRTVHVIMDNYSPHRHPTVFRWLARHPRFHMHFTPTRMSWVNAAELVFARMSQSGLRGLDCRSVIEFQIRIKEFVASLNASPRPFPVSQKCICSSPRAS